ncbi:4a-hydroxytetrahydrobiopterin dehydratase [Stella humosa]|uniref:4a-hydroxytetrahydrobiopterin dehydratase n=1 Tax=Stella humosa TaxID=94 RepID=A0A3N1ME70_9PROT|nr:4a-hydroxytetrahydrobiopterin dehydratase [Stella humosa]ROQ01858.1 4a-hydroxytetrahydrobiopterin dehydratase [Stella humosa]BBK32247.1 4a-hydroxytetrahydrobiopterin dehydratase [Stella humosa]
MRTPPPLLEDAAVDAHLAQALPAWRRDGRSIVRTFRTGGWKATMLAAGAVAHLAEVAWHHPTLTLAYDRLDIRLDTHESGGITGRDLALAAAIERTVAWQPEAPLEGTPQAPRFAYIRQE